MMVHRWLALATLLLASVEAIYEEQAGQNDWHKENIGQVTHAEFAFRGRERVFVASTASAVASLDTRDGSIAWRQVLGKDDIIGALVLVPRPASVVTLSSRGRMLRAWHALDGTLLWEKVVSDSAASAAASVLVLPDITGDGSSELAVSVGLKLQVLSAPSGKLVWTSSLSAPIVAISHGLTADEPSIAVATADGGPLHLTVFNATDGAQLSSRQLFQNAEQVTLSTDYIAAVTSNGQLCGAAIGEGSGKCQELSALAPGPLKLGEFVSGGTVALLGADSVVLADIMGNEPAGTAYPGMTAAGSLAAERGASLAVLAGVSSSGDLQADLIDVASGKTVDSAAAAAQNPNPTLGLLTASGRPLGAAKVVAGSVRGGGYDKDDKSQHRYLVVMQDDSIHYIEGGKPLWHREEGLGRIQSTLFIDLPAATAELDAELRAARPTLVDRLNAEVLTIKKSLGFLQPEEAAKLKDINSRISTHLLPQRDSNGFRRLIVALSASGKLFGLHSGNGRIVWQLALDGEIPLTRLFPWRSSHDTQHAPEVLALGTAPLSTGWQTAYAIFNAHSGRVVHSGVLPGALDKVIELPGASKDGTAEQHVFALVSPDASPVIQPLPDTAAARQLLKKQPLFFWRHNPVTGQLVGYKASSSGGVAEEQWAIAFMGPSNQVLQIAARDPQEHIYSYAKILGNRSLKLKYLNPNAIFVVSGPPDGVPIASLAEVSLTVQLIDTISGQVLYRQTLEGARGPARALLSENWAVYSYYSSLNQRYELAVLEFYDVQSRSLSIPSLLFGNQSSTLSPYAPTPLEVLHQSYFTGIGLKAMAVTATRRGITSKQLLLGTESNQVYLMDKRFVDPRRPKGTPTADEKAEMLPPYDAELPFAANLYASHKEVVEGLKGISTSPANLESTTLTLSYGLDLFFARVQPSKTFDLLPDDFPYAMLILVTVILTVGAVVLKRMEDSSAVKRKWA